MADGELWNRNHFSAFIGPLKTQSPNLLYSEVCMSTYTADANNTSAKNWGHREVESL
jgi:hypothetical protein